MVDSRSKRISVDPESKVMLSHWVQHLTSASARNFQISLEEWCTMWESFSSKPECASDWQNLYMELMFDVIDTSGIYLSTTFTLIYKTFTEDRNIIPSFFAGDGSIDEEEFCTVCSHYGISRQESSIAYKKFSKVSYLRISVPR